jgi:hypothetical protein
MKRQPCKAAKALSWSAMKPCVAGSFSSRFASTFWSTWGMITSGLGRGRAEDNEDNSGAEKRLPVPKPILHYFLLIIEEYTIFVEMHKGLTRSKFFSLRCTRWLSGRY